MWFLVIVWLHFNTPTIIIDFESQETCMQAKEVIWNDIENERLRMDAQLKRDNPSATYNPYAKAYCFKR
jgi:hypothetical protein